MEQMTWDDVLTVAKSLAHKDKTCREDLYLKLIAARQHPDVILTDNSDHPDVPTLLARPAIYSCEEIIKALREVVMNESMKLSHLSRSTVGSDKTSVGKIVQVDPFPVVHQHD